MYVKLLEPKSSVEDKVNKVVPAYTHISQPEGNAISLPASRYNLAEQLFCGPFPLGAPG